MAKPGLQPKRNFNKASNVAHQKTMKVLGVKSPPKPKKK